MSGSVRPTCGDIRLPQEEQEAEKDVHKMTAESDPIDKTATKPAPGRPSAMTLRHFNALAAALVLAATGMVGAEDIAFCILSTLYASFLSKFIFPSTSPGPEPRIFEANKALALYVLVSAFVGLFFPVLYMLEGYAAGDQAGIRAAAPHLFLLTAQVFMEGFTFWLGFSRPAWAFVPVCYNSRRLLSISNWLQAEFSHGVGRKSAWRVNVGRSLAVANMGFWSFNLFGFLLPIFLPRVFKRYYGR